MLDTEATNRIGISWSKGHWQSHWVYAIKEPLVSMRQLAVSSQTFPVLFTTLLPNEASGDACLLAMKLVNKTCVNMSS